VVVYGYWEEPESRTFNPTNIPKGARVLDVGCGEGQLLISNCDDRCSFGLDIDLSVLQLGKTRTKNVAFVCGRAEALPFRDGSFDFVIARVSLPYTDIQKSLREIGRTLKAGGLLWVDGEVISPVSDRIVQKTQVLRSLAISVAEYAALSFPDEVSPLR
jgi:ubiquinone/menaquinone biosynthesis C-methylase UbiE